MEPITEYIKAHSNGPHNPITGAQIADAMCVSGIDVRAMINVARSAGEPICSCRHGYYYSEDGREVERTIASLYSRIAKQEKAISSLKAFRDGVSCAVLN